MLPQGRWKFVMLGKVFAISYSRYIHGCSVSQWFHSLGSCVYLLAVFPARMSLREGGNTFHHCVPPSTSSA